MASDRADDSLLTPRAPARPACEPSGLRRTLRAAARLPWLTAGLIVAVSLAFAAIADLAVLEDRPVDGDSDAVTRVGAFLTELYHGSAYRVVIAMLVIGFVLESLIPARPQSRDNLWLNIPYAFMLVLFVSAIGPFLGYVSGSIVQWIGWSNYFDLRFDTGDSVLRSVGAMLVGALISDFFFYWFHRLQHHNRLLWQSHLFHHSDVALNVTTTHRTHFIEHVMSPFFLSLPMTVLFTLPTPSVAIIAVLPAVWSNFVHMNIRIGFGPLWWLLASPQYHRIHHSLRPEHLNRNFAVWFPIWDVLFGTAYAPRRGEYPETGVDGVLVETLPAAVRLPFVRWWGMARSRWRDRASHHG